MHSSTFAVVIDSNVIIDLYSVHNLSQADDDKRDFRVERARDALLFAICLHAMRATTYGIHEPVSVLPKKVPPGSVTPELHFTTCVTHFVVPVALSGWTPEADSNHRPTGSLADHFLLDRAHEFGKPLITSEKKLAALARAKGVPVFTPGEFWPGRIDRTRSARCFLSRFRSLAPPFARQMEHAANWARLLDMVFEFYVFLLLGRRE